MTNVTRFPHYHQAENVVTNHLMVLLRVLYNSSPKLLEALLQALCAEEVRVGPQFSQQIAGAHSIPDGLVLQEPLAIFIETKLGSAINQGQLQWHCRTIVERLPGRKGSFLISLTSGQPGQIIPPEINSIALEQNITIVPTTFGELVTQMAELPVTDLILQETLQEFVDFIFAQDLVPRKEQYMVAMLTRTTWQDNVAHGVYYEPVDRNPKWQQAAFLGLYHDRRVSHVGRIITAVYAMQDDTGSIAFDEPELGSLDERQRQAVRDVIEAARPYYPELAKWQHRYYIVDEFAATDFRKSTPGGMMGHRYFDVEGLVGKRLPRDATSIVAAQALNGRDFGYAK